MNSAWLVTGSSGFIGTALLQALQAAAPQQPLWLAGRRDARPALAHWQPLKLDLSGPALTLPAGVHTVLNLAGEKRDATRMPAVNADGATRLVDAAAQAGARRFVHLSSVGVYGAARHGGMVNESSAHAARGPYESSKDAGERAVRQRCAEQGLSCVVLQPSNVVGLQPGRGFPLLGLVRVVARGWFRYFGRGEPWVNYVAVEDVATALLAAARQDAAEGVFILNTPVRLTQFVGWLADELSLPPPVHRLPGWLGAAAAATGSVAGRVLGRSMPFDLARFGELTNTTRYDGSAWQRAFDTGYPVGMEASLRSLVRQYRAMGQV